MAEDLSKKLYVQDVAAWEKGFSRKRFCDDKIKVQVIERGIVLPARHIDEEWKGGVCDNDFNFIAGYTRTYANGSAQRTTRGGVVLCSICLRR